MECRDAMESLSAYVDGEVAAGEGRRIEEHLEACPGCRDRERKMRAVGIGVARTETDVPPQFREKLFSRMESEDLLPRRRSIFVYSLRWAAIPLAAAAGLALFLLSTDVRIGDRAVTGVPPPQVAQRAPAEAPGPASSPAAIGGAGDLTPEERDIVANLELLEDPLALDESREIDELEIFAPIGSRKG